MTRMIPWVFAIVFLSGLVLFGASDAQEPIIETRPTPFIMNEDHLASIRRRAEAGDVVAQTDLAGIYATHFSHPQDYAEAERWWRIAAEQGNVRGQLGLGLLYEQGNGVEQDYDEAARWFRKAAMQDDPSAMQMLGALYAKGLASPPEGAELTDWTQKAQEQRIADRERWHAERYASALSNYTRSAATDGPQAPMAMMELATLYADGRPWFPEDSVQAYKWLTIAMTSPTLKLDELGEQMTPDEIAEAERLAREWWDENR